MGYQTSVMVLNDDLLEIKDDPNFGRNLCDAIVRLRHGIPNDVSAQSADGRRIHCSAATVIETHHADQTSAVIFGGNIGQSLGTIGGWNYDVSKPEDRVKILKKLADAEGYTLHKKPVKK